MPPLLAAEMHQALLLHRRSRFCTASKVIFVVDARGSTHKRCSSRTGPSWPNNPVHIVMSCWLPSVSTCSREFRNHYRSPVPEEHSRTCPTSRGGWLFGDLQLMTRSLGS